MSKGMLMCTSCSGAIKQMKSWENPKKKKEETSDPVCKGCGKVIDGEYVFGDPEDAFHETCFTCAGCSCTLEGEFAVDMDGDKKLYLCASCFGDANPDVELRPDGSETTATASEADAPSTATGDSASGQAVTKADAPRAGGSGDSSGGMDAASQMKMKMQQRRTLLEEGEKQAPQKSGLRKSTRASTVSDSGPSEEGGPQEVKVPKVTVNSRTVSFSGKDDTLEYNPQREEDAGNGIAPAPFETDESSFTGAPLEDTCVDRCTKTCVVQ